MKSIIKNNPIKTRRKFDKTFKLEVVRNWLTSGKSAAVIGKELDLNESLLFAWRKLLPPAEAGGRAAAGGSRRVASDLQSQLDAARRENLHLREQRDILKKTLGILSEPSGTDSRGFTR